MGGGQSCRLSFEEFAHLENIVNVLARELGDCRAVVGPLLQQSVLGQLSQGVVDRRPADIELSAQCDFADDGARH